jgi:hypothetical protein
MRITSLIAISFAAALLLAQAPPPAAAPKAAPKAAAAAPKPGRLAGAFASRLGHSVGEGRPVRQPDHQDSGEREQARQPDPG